MHLLRIADRALAFQYGSPGGDHRDPRLCSGPPVANRAGTALILCTCIQVRSFSRLGPRRSALDCDGLLLATLEKVGFQFLPLRQVMPLSV